MEVNIYLDPNNTAMLKTGFFRKIEKSLKKYKVKTQKTRTELILDLKVLLELAHKQATEIPERGKFTKERLKSAQLVSSLARTINIIANSYDEKKIMKELEALHSIAAKVERKQREREHKQRTR